MYIGHEQRKDITTGSWPTVTNFYTRHSRDLTAICWLHQMHHRRQVQQVFTAQTSDEETQGSSSGDLFALSQSIRFLANAEDDRQVRRRIADLQRPGSNYRRMLAESDDPSSARARFYQEEVQQINEEVEALLQPFNATPISQIGTPRTTAPRRFFD